jgi:hypothetical protein
MRHFLASSNFSSKNTFLVALLNIDKIDIQIELTVSAGDHSDLANYYSHRGWINK